MSRPVIYPVMNKAWSLQNKFKFHKPWDSVSQGTWGPRLEPACREEMLLNLEAVGTSWDLRWVNCRTKRGGLQGRNDQVSEVDTESNTLFSFAQKWSKRRWEGTLELLPPPLSYNYSSSILRWQTVRVCAYKMSPRSRRLNYYFPYTSVFLWKRRNLTHCWTGDLTDSSTSCTGKSAVHLQCI